MRDRFLREIVGIFNVVGVATNTLKGVTFRISSDFTRGVKPKAPFNLALLPTIGDLSLRLTRVASTRGAEVEDPVGTHLFEYRQERAFVQKIAGDRAGMGGRCRSSPAERRLTDQAPHGVPTLEEPLGHIEAELTRDPGDQGRRHRGNA
jgi:hypothetical protein